ncbi:hypothetical protein GGI12_005480, partial [Dipsacomyces acuminosporus]
MSGDIRDPIGTSDTVNIAVMFAMYGITFMLGLVGWINRSYKPIRTKRPLNLILMLLCGILWSVGALVTNGLVRIVGPWSICKLWTVWFRLTWHYWFFFLLIYRTYALHRVFIQGKSCTGWKYYIPVMVMCVYTLTFNLTSTLLPAKMTIGYRPELEACIYNDAMQLTCLSCTFVFWIIYTVYIVLIRNIRSSFNELGEALIVYMAGTSMILVIIVMHVFDAKYPLHRKVRIASATIDSIFIISPMWLFLAKPVYMCLFHHDSYLEEWQQKLANDGLARVYKLQDGEAAGVSTTTYSRLEEGNQRKDSQYNQASQGTSNGTYTNDMRSSAGGY